MLAGLSPIGERPVEARFDAGPLSSDAGRLVLGVAKRRLGVAKRRLGVAKRRLGVAKRLADGLSAPRAPVKVAPACRR